MFPLKSTLVFLLTGLAVCGASSGRPDQLRCEYRTNPLGIDVVTPRLSWTMTAEDVSRRGLRQSAYRILVASNESGLRANAGDLWDSSRTESNQSNQIAYHGRALKSGQAAFWKVKIWDGAGEASDWSQPAQWSMGMLSPEDWHGKWIGRDESGPVIDPLSPYAALQSAHWVWAAENSETGGKTDAYFRAHFDVPTGRALKRAVAVAGANLEADVFVNGQMITSRSPAAIPSIVDVTYLVRPGQNVIAIHATYTKPQGSHEKVSPPAAIGAVKLEFTSGEPITVTTSDSWRGTVKSAEGWEQIDYSDGQWPIVSNIGSYGMKPWGQAGFEESHRLAARMLRKEFTPKKEIRRASIYFSGLGLSELHVNGSKVGDAVLSPGLTDYDKHVFYVTYDVTSQLKPGPNAIGLLLGNGRYFAPRTNVPIATRSFGYPKALVELDIDYADGTHDRVVSDETWKLTTRGPIRANNEYDGEEYDAREEMKRWDQPNFGDAQWEPAHVVVPPAGKLLAQMAEPMKVIETIRPVSMKRLRPGVYLYDLGQNMVGWMRLTVSGPPGTEVTLRHAETLDSKGELYTANLRSARATDVYILKGAGTEVWEPRFTYHGFRYVELSGYPGTPNLSALEGRVVHDAMEQTADFVSSNDLLNKIHHNIFWGVRGNYRSIPTDCPQRDERQGWLGDRSQVSRSESYLFNVAAFYSNWMTDLADSALPSGSIPDVVPNYWTLYNDNLTWPSSFLFIPGMLYDQYGDKRVMARDYPAMKKWLEHIRSFEKDGLMPKDTYGDWCVPPESPTLIHSQDPTRVTDKTLIGTAYYYDLLQVMARYARVLDIPADTAEFQNVANTVQAAFQKRFFNEQRGLYDNGTQTSSILPLYFQMTPRENRNSVLEALRTNIETVSHGHAGTGLVGAQWLMRTLTENGLSDVAFQIATQKTYPGLGYMVEQGATTVWELWNGDTADPAMNSGNHVMQIGDIGVWMYEYLVGIRSNPDKPGFQHTIVRPYLAGDLSFVSGSHRSMYGKVTSSWKRESGTVALNITVPPNTTATVWVPTGKGAAITESEIPAEKAAGVKLVRAVEGSAVYDLTSGTYRFRSRL